MWSAVLTVALTGCAPTRVVERDDDVQTGQRTQVGPGFDRKMVAAVRLDNDGAEVDMQSVETCQRYEERALHRTHVVERHASALAQALFYIGAVAGVGSGAWVLADVPNIPEPNDPKTQNPVGRAGATAIGVIQLIGGAASLAGGIATSVRGRNSKQELGTIYQPQANTATNVRCHGARARGQALSLILSSDQGGRIALGNTDDLGRMAFTWEAIPPATLAHAVSDQGTLEDSAGTSLGTVDLTPARKYWAARMLQRASTLADRDEVDQALDAVKVAMALGADTGSVSEKIAGAPTSVARAAQKRAEIQGHLDRAWAFVRKDKPVDAPTRSGPRQGVWGRRRQGGRGDPTDPHRAASEA